MATISLCVFFAAPSASSASNHSGQVLPVFAFTASSLIDGLIVAPIRCPLIAATLNRRKFLTRWRSSFLSVHLKNASGQRHTLLQLPATRGLHPRLPVHHIEFHRRILGRRAFGFRFARHYHLHLRADVRHR